LNFLDRISKNSEISNLIKIRLVGAELFRADGRTDGQTEMTKERVAFRSFANTPESLLPICYNNAEIISIEIFSAELCYCSLDILVISIEIFSAELCYCSLDILVPLISQYCQRCG